MRQVLWRSAHRNLTHIWVIYEMCLVPWGSPLLIHATWMQMHFWPSKVSALTNSNKFIQKHILYVSFLLIVLEPCYSPHHTMKPVFDNHSPLQTFLRSFLLVYFFCTQGRLESGLSNIVIFSWIIWPENDDSSSCLSWTQLISLNLVDITFKGNDVINP